jgi:6-pyruvoyltetrahydropterin/6-carboxytetrahydropterin synthase
MFVTKIFTFDSAHFLTNYYGKCERMHGHTYTLEVTLEGDVQSNGLIIDFVVLKRMVKKHVLDKLDHQILNDVIENPSAERVVLWIWDQLKDLQKLLSEEQGDPNLGDDIKKYFKAEDAKDFQKMDFGKTLRLHELKLWETPTSCVTYNGK